MEYFRNFQGFGINGTFIGSFEENVVDVARRILSENRGRSVVLDYLNTKSGRKLTHRDSSCEERQDRIQIPKNGSLDRILYSVKTDNIEISFLDGEKEAFELQKLVVGDEWIVELRKLDYNIYSYS